MSLINEALKKAAQRQSTSAGPLPPNTGTPTPVATGTHHTPKIWVIAAVLSIIGIALIAAITFSIWVFVLSSEKSGPPTAANPEPSTSHSDSPPPATAVERIAFTPPPTSPAPEAETKPQPAVQPEKPATASADPTPAPPTPPPAPSPQSVATNPQPINPTPPVPQPTPPPAPKANPAIVTYIQDIQIRGVMAGGGKVLLYKPDTQRTHAYEAGAVLDGQLNVLIYRIEERQIQFRDNDGFIYTKRF